MVLTDEGRKRLSLFAKSRERTSTGRFLPLGTKYVYDMTYIKLGAYHDTPSYEKWLHVRITIYSKKQIPINQLRKMADIKKPCNYVIPKGNRNKFEAFQVLRYSKKQAKREEIDDQEYHQEDYTGKGGGLRNT